jgi:hypothetical protein
MKDALPNNSNLLNMEYIVLVDASRQEMASLPGPTATLLFHADGRLLSLDKHAGPPMPLPALLHLITSARALLLPPMLALFNKESSL